MNKIISILNQVRIVSQKIKEQRKEKFERGEKFNIFNDLGFISDEVHLHSMFMANLLNPRGSHGQGAKFLGAFLKMLQKNLPTINADSLELEAANSSVEVEKYIGKQTEDEGGRIDIFLTDGKHSIIIENKIYAGDQHHQMLRYWNYGVLQKGDDAEKTFVLVYLTLDGNPPSKESLVDTIGEDEIVCLSYKSDIRGWLDHCVELSSRIPLVRETINQYINTIDILTNNVMESNKELLDILGKEENLDAVFDIINSKENLLNHIMNDEFLPKLKELSKKKGLEMVGDYKRNWMSEKYPGVHFRKAGWKYFDLAFQFDHIGLRGLVFGFVCKINSERKDVPASVWEEVQKHYSINSSIKDLDNGLWIHKNFMGNQYWDNAQAIKDLLNGKTLNDFSAMFDEALGCVEGLDI